VIEAVKHTWNVGQFQMIEAVKHTWNVGHFLPDDAGLCPRRHLHTCRRENPKPELVKANVGCYTCHFTALADLYEIWDD
jgi:hypothetical protein